MELLKITSTADTPEVYINSSAGIISIKGRSFSEDSVTFFSKISLKIEEYFKIAGKETSIELGFEYFNSASYKLIINLLMNIKKIAPAGHNLNIKWFYEIDDDDILQLGKETERLTQIPFQYYPVEITSPFS
jgi:hypothetical protein